MRARGGGAVAGLQVLAASASSSWSRWSGRKAPSWVVLPLSEEEGLTLPQEDVWRRIDKLPHSVSMGRKWRNKG